MSSSLIFDAHKIDSDGQHTLWTLFLELRKARETMSIELFMTLEFPEIKSKLYVDHLNHIFASKICVESKLPETNQIDQSKSSQGLACGGTVR